MTGFENIIGVNPWTALFTFCNLIITFLLLKKFLFGPVQKMIQDRQNEIDGLYDDANRAKEEAISMQEEYRAHLDSANAQRDAILRQATVAAREKEQKILAQADAEVAALREKATRDIALDRKRAINEVKNEISGIAMEIASKVVEKELDHTDHQSLVEDFIEKLGDEA